jgi:Na+/H+ antiporter NhaA
MNVKHIVIVTVGGVLFWILMEKSGVYAKIEKML